MFLQHLATCAVAPEIVGYFISRPTPATQAAGGGFKLQLPLPRSLMKMDWNVDDGWKPQNRSPAPH